MGCVFAQGDDQDNFARQPTGIGGAQRDRSGQQVFGSGIADEKLQSGMTLRDSTFAIQLLPRIWRLSVDLLALESYNAALNDT
jgi:hypothetical protein